MGGERGFRGCAGHARSPALKAALLACAESCRAAVAQLQGQVAELGGAPAVDGMGEATLQRGWVAPPAVLSSADDRALLAECERAEDAALASYREAFRAALPPRIRRVVETQYQGVQCIHTQIGALRETLQAA